MVKQRINTFVTETAVKVVEIDCPDKETSEILIHHVLDLKQIYQFILLRLKRIDLIRFLRIFSQSSLPPAYVLHEKVMFSATFICLSVCSQVGPPIDHYP